MARTIVGANSPLEEESEVQLVLVEILTRSDETNSGDDVTVTDDQDSDFEQVTTYLETHSSSSIIVKLACQTLEKVDTLLYFLIH